MAVVSPRTSEIAGCRIGLEASYGALSVIGYSSSPGFAERTDSRAFTGDFRTAREPSFYY